MKTKNLQIKTKIRSAAAAVNHNGTRPGLKVKAKVKVKGS
jgi:hypothetical protein